MTEEKKVQDSNNSGVLLKKEKDLVKTVSMYEAAYYLSLGCKIEGLKIIKELGRDACLIIMSGELIKTHQINYLSSQAFVDPILYQKAISEIRSLVFDKIGKKKPSKGATHE